MCIVQVCSGEATAAKVTAWVSKHYTGSLHVEVMLRHSELASQPGSCDPQWAEVQPRRGILSSTMPIAGMLGRDGAICQVLAQQRLLLIGYDCVALQHDFLALS